MSTLPTPLSPAESQYPAAREAPVGPQDAGRFLNMHTKTVLRKARSGSLPAHPVGGIRKRWHFYLSELDDWLRSQKNTSSQSRRALEAATLAHRRAAQW
jgi:excisionase family DNA binding protein